MGHFFRLRLVFWSPWAAFLRTWDTILVVLGSRETPNGHTDAQMSVFNDFWSDLGTLLEHTLGTIFWFSVIWGGELGESFQVHVFRAPRMEMMPECNDWMCHNHCKNNVFWRISLFYLFSNSVSRGWDLAHILMPFGRHVVTFSDFWGSWRQAWNFMIF